MAPRLGVTLRLVAGVAVASACGRSGLEADRSGSSAGGESTNSSTGGESTNSGAGGGQGSGGDEAGGAGAPLPLTGGTYGKLVDANASGAAGLAPLGRGGAAATHDGGMEHLDAGRTRRGDLCVGVQGPLESLALWVDSRGPFVLASTGTSGIAVFGGSPDGWHLIYRQSDNGGPGIGLRAYPDGDLVVFGSLRCGIVVLHDGSPECTTGFGGGISDLFIASKPYALEGGRALVYDMGLWQAADPPLESPSEASVLGWRIWADDRVVAATTTTGDVFVAQDGGPFGLQTGLSADPYRVVWGLSDGSLWVGGRQGELFSHSGTRWSARGTFLDTCGSGITGMWGSGDVLYFHTQHSILRWNGDAEQVVMELPCSTTIRGLWGTSASDVDVLVSDETKRATTCGEATLLPLVEQIHSSIRD